MMQNIKEDLKQLMAELFRCDVTELSDETGPGDILGWDSLGHVALMARIQERFGSHVPVEDAIEVESITDLVDILERLSKGTGPICRNGPQGALHKSDLSPFPGAPQ